MADSGNDKANREPCTTTRTFKGPDGREFELEVVDMGAAFKATSDSAVACFSCYCGSGCLCGCIN